jgi:hypothetical protein
MEVPSSRQRQDATSGRCLQGDAKAADAAE